MQLLGYEPWLDEIKIRAGDSIPDKIQKGLQETHYQIVILSTNSSQSQWVKIEWMSKLMDELQERRTIIIPILLEECEIPQLLKYKKYADFTGSYNYGLEEVISSIS